MDTSCAPLALRSNYSLLYGTTPLDRLPARVREAGYRSVALTDINNLYGAVAFYKAAIEAGLKPILGSDVRHGGSQAVLLVRNLEGYANLCRILTRLHLDEQFNLAEAIICFQDGLHILTPDVRLAGQLRSAIEHGYLRLLRPYPRQSENADRNIRESADTLGLEWVATPDVVFLDPEEQALHRVLTAVRENTIISKLPESTSASRRQFLISRDAFQRAARDDPTGMRNNMRLAEDCNLDLPMGTPIFPKFPLPDGITPHRFLRRLCREGLWRRYPTDTWAARRRLEHELQLIEELGFTEYFIFMWDILGITRERGIATIGRGSGASSIVSYLLGITQVDPIAYRIPFERFLNRNRADCPDLDVDLCWIKRDEVIESIYEKYGADRVAMVSTHSTFRLRGAVRETAKAFGLSNSLANRISRRLPYDVHGSVADALAHRIPESLRNCINPDTWRQVIRFAQNIRGFPRHLGIHCGGVVIGDRPLDRYVPLERATKGVVITQYEKDSIEDIGLVKMDFLGNHGLTIRDDSLRLIAREKGQRVEVTDIPMRDERTATLLRTGGTIGCCQLESPAMRNLLQMLQAGSCPELMQALALIRPGPASMGMKERFVRRARGLEPPAVSHPALEEVLIGSYGIMLYEDHAMESAAALMGGSLTEGDVIRKAISKAKTPDDLRKASRAFFERALDRGIPTRTLETVWSHMAQFNAYSFCKAHAASYARLAWHLAWLKAHHPLEFMVAVLNHQWGMYPRRVHVEAARRLGLTILPPCVNQSQRGFSAEDGAIRIGLDQVKGLTESAIRRTLDARNGDPYHSVTDFMARVALSQEELDALILCGAFDFTQTPRPMLIWEGRTNASSRESASSTSLLCRPESPPAPRLPDYPPETKLRYETEILELSVSRHPMAPFRPTLRRRGFTDSSKLRSAVGKRIRIAGLLAALRETDTKRNDGMQFLTLEDEYGVIEAVLFPRAYRRYRHLIRDAGPYAVTGVAQEQYGAITVNAHTVTPLSELRFDATAPALSA